jgi:hypothetical protein
MKWRIFRRQYIGISQQDKDVPGDSIVKQYEFIIYKEEVDKHEFITLLEEMFGPAIEDQDDEEEDYLFGILNYVAIDFDDMIVVTGPNPKYYGDEVLAFWLPDNKDLSAVQDLSDWEKDRVPW